MRLNHDKGSCVINAPGVYYYTIRNINMRSHKYLEHDDVIKWKHFPRNWPFVRGITGPGEFPTQMPVTRSFDVFFDLRLNIRLSKQP